MRTGSLEGLHKWLLMTKAERKKLERECREKQKQNTNKARIQGGEAMKFFIEQILYIGGMILIVAIRLALNNIVVAESVEVGL